MSVCVQCTHTHSQIMNNPKDSWWNGTTYICIAQSVWTISLLRFIRQDIPKGAVCLFYHVPLDVHREQLLPG